jgi:two-component system response regulator FixJ
MSPLLYLIAVDPKPSGVAQEIATAKGVSSVVVRSSDSFIEQYVCEAVGCVIVDATLDPNSTLGFLNEIALRGNAQIPTIILHATPTIPLVVDVMREGAAAVVSHDALPKELPAQIDRAIALDAERLPQRKEMFYAQGLLAKLTKEESRILTLILDGWTNKDIALRLDMGLRTVEKRRNAITGKLHADSLPDMVRVFMRSGVRHLPVLRSLSSPFLPNGNHDPKIDARTATSLP